ncbi:BTB/POZ domain-containing protein 7 [Desmophyllum pertusum]|uniref:BTB/POZ domain-containing protein 7 n=1 Tax=Desmophyllum pertusum TaxID=174260 RepID=A0A9X0A2U8_9CNID|nr:BTB/POZ domain-containing protein 7 [Desmophyllum pertusum]
MEFRGQEIYASGTHKLLTSAEIAMEVFEVASFIDLPVLVQGCEDIILEELSPSTLFPTLEWSSLPHGSGWVYRQAMQFLQDEFVNIAQSDAFSLIPIKYLAEALKSDFLQACEHDVFVVCYQMGRGTGYSTNETSKIQSRTTRRTPSDVKLTNKQLKKVLSGVIEHVRIGHVLPPHSELLEGVFRRGLADRGMPLDIGEGSFYPNLPWMRRREEKDFVRPRLFLPYFEEAKVILEEHKEAEVELIRHRMSRVSHNMPDTLYMVGSQKRSHTAPALFFPAAAAGRLERDERSSMAQKF